MEYTYGNSRPNRPRKGPRPSKFESNSPGLKAYPYVDDRASEITSGFPGPIRLADQVPLASSLPRRAYAAPFVEDPALSNQADCQQAGVDLLTKDLDELAEVRQICRGCSDKTVCLGYALQVGMAESVERGTVTETGMRGAVTDAERQRWIANKALRT